MEKLIKKLFLSGCLVTVAAASFTLLTSSFASAATQAQSSPSLSVTVPKTLTLSGAAMAEKITADWTKVVSKNLGVTVKANAGFTISLHAATTNLTSSGNTIPASSSVTAGTSGWGIKKKPTADSTADADTYTGMTTSAAEFYRQTTPQTTAQTYNFPVGVAVSRVQAPGDYTTTVTVTAANTN